MFHPSVSYLRLHLHNIVCWSDTIWLRLGFHQFIHSPEYTRYKSLSAGPVFWAGLQHNGLPKDCVLFIVLWRSSIDVYTLTYSLIPLDQDLLGLFPIPTIPPFLPIISPWFVYHVKLHCLLN